MPCAAMSLATSYASSRVISLRTMSRSTRSAPDSMPMSSRRQPDAAIRPSRSTFCRRARSTSFGLMDAAHASPSLRAINSSQNSTARRTLTKKSAS